MIGTFVSSLPPFLLPFLRRPPPALPSPPFYTRVPLPFCAPISAGSSSELFIHQSAIEHGKKNRPTDDLGERSSLTTAKRRVYPRKFIVLRTVHEDSRHEPVPSTQLSPCGSTCGKSNCRRAKPGTHSPFDYAAPLPPSPLFRRRHCVKAAVSLSSLLRLGRRGGVYTPIEWRRRRRRLTGKGVTEAA